MNLDQQRGFGSLRALPPDPPPVATPKMRLRDCLIACAASLLVASTALAQPEPPGGGQGGAGGATAAAAAAATKDLTKEAMQVLHAQRSAPEPGAPGTLAEIFPDSSKVWMSVHNVDPVPVEFARRGGPWLCASGCRLENVSSRQTDTGDSMLRSIKMQTPTLPLPVTIWGRRGTGKNEVQQLYFDPVLIGRRAYGNVCAYKPPEGPPAGGGKPRKPEVCMHEPPPLPTPDSGELTLGLRWPDQSDAANFHYLAVVDSCGNARVQPFQRTFTVPVVEVVSGGCGKPDGKVLRIFPEGGWIRVTAFNLDEPAAGDIVNLTYRVTVPPLENLVESDPARLLFPDALVKDLRIDCGPLLLKAAPDAAGIPRPPPGLPAAPPGAAPPGAAPPGPPGAKTPPPKPGQPPPKAGAPPTGPPPTGPPPPSGADQTASTPGAKPLAHESLIIAPEPLRQGNCRLQITGQLKRRLAAPLVLQVLITRTDIVQDNGTPVTLHEAPWVLTPSSDYFPIPPLRANYDGESRIRVAIFSDPLSPNGKAVLLSDATKVASTPKSQASTADGILGARRLVGSVTIHSAPLCGESNFETLDAAGSCLRAYLTVPIMLASLQITRAPWVEKPLVSRQFLNSIGIALAIDSYDPVERRAFPVALQIGGFLQNLEQNRVGLLGYIGIAPTIPVLGEKGNTTSVGLLGGVGMSYIFNDVGPDEGIKPAAFVSIVVQVGQATPKLSAGAQGKAEAAFTQSASASGSVNTASNTSGKGTVANTSTSYASLSGGTGTPPATQVAKQTPAQPTPEEPTTSPEEPTAEEPPGPTASVEPGPIVDEPPDEDIAMDVEVDTEE